MQTKKQMNTRLTFITHMRLNLLAQEYGTKTAAIELAVRNLYVEEMKINKAFKKKVRDWNKKQIM